MEVASVAFPQWAMMVGSLASLKDDLLQNDSGSVKVRISALLGNAACFRLEILTPDTASKWVAHTHEARVCMAFDAFQRALCERCIPFDAQRTDSNHLTMHRVGKDLISRFLTDAGPRIETISEAFEDEALAIASALLADDERVAAHDLKMLVPSICSLTQKSSSLVMVAACRRGRARESLAMLRENGWLPTADDAAQALCWMGEFVPPSSAIFQLQALRSELECAEFFSRVRIIPKFLN